MTPQEDRRRHDDRNDRAIYGSLLAASVVVAISNGGGDSHYVSPLLLAVWLIAIGLVFWLAHVYLRLVGDRIDDASLNWWEIRRAARHEWPIFRAALPLRPPR